MKILDRYIMSEMAGPFLFGVCTFTLLFFSAETLMGVAKMVLESGAGAWTVIEYMYCRLPYVLIMTFPMSILLSAIMAYGRLSGDSEIVALKAGGIGFVRLFIPGLTFCAFVAVIALIMNEYWVPPTMKRGYNMILEMKPDETVERTVLTSPRLLPNGDEQMVYARVLNTRDQVMSDVYIHHYRDGKRFLELYSEQARWNAQDKAWEVKDVKATTFDLNTGNVLYEAATAKGWTQLERDKTPPGPDALLKRKLRSEEMSRQELREYLASLPPVTEGDDESRKKRNKYEVQLYQKVSLPMTCLVFGAFAIPLGIRPHRTSTSIGFGLSLLFILLYYVLMTVGMILGESGKAPAWVGAWIPNIVFGLVGLYLAYDAARK